MLVLDPWKACLDGSCDDSTTVPMDCVFWLQEARWGDFREQQT